MVASSSSLRGLEMRVFHYTVVNYLPAIFERSYIMPTAKAREEEQAVWFSVNPEWEETANKAYHRGDGVPVQGDKWETYKIYGGLARVEVVSETAPYSWEQYKNKSKISVEKVQEIEAYADNCNADTGQWRVSLDPVLKECFIGVEVLDWDKQIWEDFIVRYEKTKKRMKDHKHHD